jgi:hypothetical protein
MLFLIHFEIDPENRDKSHVRLKTLGDGMPQKIKPLGTWFSVTLLEGWAIVETQDETALGQSMKQWTDLNVNHITPVLTEEALLKVIT